MRTIVRVRLIAVLGVLLIVSALPGAACAAEPAAAAPAAKFVLSLTDGTRLMFTPEATAIPVKTSYATMDIPFEKIASAKVSGTNRTIQLTLQNGDKLQGELSIESLKIKTAIGDFTVPVAYITEIATKTAAKPAERKYSDSPAKRNACINNLRMIDAAKEQSAMANRLTDGQEADPASVAEYLRGNAIPVCPSGGTYTLNPIGKLPTCSVPGHTLDTAGGAEWKWEQ